MDSFCIAVNALRPSTCCARRHELGARQDHPVFSKREVSEKSLLCQTTLPVFTFIAYTRFHFSVIIFRSEIDWQPAISVRGLRGTAADHGIVRTGATSPRQSLRMSAKASGSSCLSLPTLV